MQLFPFRPMDVLVVYSYILHDERREKTTQKKCIDDCWQITNDGRYIIFICNHSLVRIPSANNDRHEVKKHVYVSQRQLGLLLPFFLSFLSFVVFLLCFVFVSNSSSISRSRFGVVDVMVSMLAQSVVDRVFAPRSCQTKDHYISVFLLLSLVRINQCQDNMSKWSDMVTCSICFKYMQLSL